MHTDDRRTVSGCFLFADHGLTEAAEAILDRCPIRSYRKGELIYSRDCFERRWECCSPGRRKCSRAGAWCSTPCPPGTASALPGSSLKMTAMFQIYGRCVPAGCCCSALRPWNSSLRQTMPLPLAISGFCPGASASSTRSWTPLPPLPRRGALWSGCWKIWTTPGW